MFNEPYSQMLNEWWINFHIVCLSKFFFLIKKRNSLPKTKSFSDAVLFNSRSAIPGTIFKMHIISMIRICLFIFRFCKTSFSRKRSVVQAVRVFNVNLLAQSNEVIHGENLFSAECLNSKFWILAFKVCVW